VFRGSPQTVPAAQWSGLYDRMHPHKPDEMDRRLAVAADFGEIL
jgi:hypothetical protein